MTPLHIAADKGHNKIIRALLAAKANPNAETKMGLTPLHLAADKGHTNVVRALLAAKANPNAYDKIKNSTPLHTACVSPAAVRTLLNNGANPCVVDINHQTPLHIAAINGNTVVLRVLLRALSRHSCNVDPCDKRKGRTPLHYAAAKGHSMCCSALLTAGANVNARDAYNRTPLANAALADQTKSTDLLLSRGADPNPTDQCGYTPLQLAAGLGRVQGKVRTGPFTAILKKHPQTACARLPTGAHANDIDQIACKIDAAVRILGNNQIPYPQCAARLNALKRAEKWRRP